MRTLWMCLSLMAAEAEAQETREDAELGRAIENTAAAGFAYHVRPVASIPDGFPQERLVLAGTPVVGTYTDGIYHARDGSYEIYRKGSRVAIRTEGGWLPLHQYTSPLRGDLAQAFDDRDGRLWRRGNVTAGRKALLQLIRIQHLDHRTNVGLLRKLGTAFVDLHAVESGRQGRVLEGDLAETAAFGMLQGPYAALVERGTLAFRKPSGVGRVTIQDGLIRRILLKASGAYDYYQDADNVRRRGLCTLEIAIELTRHGEVRIDPPREVAHILATEPE